MKHLNIQNLIVSALLLAPIIYLNSVFAKLPNQVALHFGSDMKPDRYGEKSELWTTVFIMMGIALIAYLVLTNIDKIDPKKQKLQSKTLMEKIGLTLVGFMSLINIYIIYSGYNPTDGKFLFVMLGGLFAALGNFIHNVKPNYFVGMRFPWALENEDNWRKTHQLGGKLWVVGGLLIAISSFFLSVAIMSKLMFWIVTIMVLIPAFHSYRIYKNAQTSI